MFSGFRFRNRSCGDPPTIQKLTVKEAEVLTEGDLVELVEGEVKLAKATGTTILGECMQTLSVAAVAGSTHIQVITDPDAVYSVEDNNARKMGDVLDMTGTTGAMKLTADSHHNFIVVAPSAINEPTLVKINPGAQWAAKAH